MVVRELIEARRAGASSVRSFTSTG